MPDESLCPHCSGVVQVPAATHGQSVRCPLCRSVFVAGPAEPPPVEVVTPTEGPPRRRRRLEDDDDFDDRPRRRRHRADDDDPDRRAEVIEYARDKVKGPATVLQVYGAILVVVGLLAVVGAVVALTLGADALKPAPKANGPANGLDEDLVFWVAYAGCAGGLGLVVAPVIIVGGTRMKSLGSYSWGMAAVITTMVFGFLFCILFGLLGIWPLMALSDGRVKRAFEYKQRERSVD